MASISLGDHFQKFVQEQVERGRYQNASEVVRAGLRLLEDHELDLQERRRRLKVEIDKAWEDPRPSVPAEEVFERIEALHTATVGKPPAKRG